MMKIVPVILAGGVGSRLWPLSRTQCPKQFQNFGRDYSIFQMTINRFSQGNFCDPVVVTSDQFEVFVQSQLSEIDVVPSLVISEPASRNTAPAIIMAALAIRRRNPDACMLVLPSDHLLNEEDGLNEAVAIAVEQAKKAKLVTFGVEPTYAETGYGYIECGVDLGEGAKVVNAFVEKPGPEAAQRMISDGGYLWNSGMFVLPVRPFLAECQRLMPDLLAGCIEALGSGQFTGDIYRPEVSLFSKLESISIDHAIMEKTDLAAVVPLKCDWTDLGSWHAVWQTGEKDASDNVVTGEVVLLDTRGSLIHSPDTLTCVSGLSDVVVINTGDAVLVASRDGSQKVKDLTEVLRERGRVELDVPRLVHRPWGTYQTVDAGKEFQVKRIVVKPGGILSLQYHLYRSEHWTVVSGEATVTIGKLESQLVENESAFIPIGEVHRLKNEGDSPVVLIEVQYGSYLGEDDIVRLEDVYGRVADVSPELIVAD
ncbi:MAG: mannose-1-phosphate guanylyltransferase/mannose-6-phosphate isomerase [Rhodobiaceae bacterium]|nr:MAG: mannose-1-phosphate guanylyltransferase/mannose-6-phosphate isomerase [Rhodobiaceae bacterium]